MVEESSNYFNSVYEYSCLKRDSLLKAQNLVLTTSNALSRLLREEDSNKEETEEVKGCQV